MFLHGIVPCYPEKQKGPCTRDKCCRKHNLKDLNTPEANVCILNKSLQRGSSFSVIRFIIAGGYWISRSGPLAQVILIIFRWKQTKVLQDIAGFSRDQGGLWGLSKYVLLLCHHILRSKCNQSTLL